MKVLFTHEMHAVKYKGQYYNFNGATNYAHLQNYLHSADEGILLTRYKGEVDSLEPHWPLLSGDNIEIECVPYFSSPAKMLTKLPTILKATSRAIKRSDIRIARLPGAMGLAGALAYWLLRKPYGVEFAGHPIESIVEMRKKKGLKPGFAVKIVDWANKFFVKRAVAIAYRSQYLRDAYPCGRTDREIIFSGAQLLPEVITSSREKSFFESDTFRLMYLGRVSPEKGCYVLLDAFEQVCRKSAKHVVMRMVGDGPDIESMQQKARQMGLEDRLEFTGRVEWGPQLFTWLDDAHLFILPSLTEGMPRSLIEAMARGMPAIGSNCGGIPELLEPENLVEPGNADILAERIMQLVDNPDQLTAMSQRNFEASKLHWPDHLNREKSKFWKLVIEHAR